VNSSNAEILSFVGTIFALACLSRRHAAKKGEWIILASKARSFLIKRLRKFITPATADWNVKLLDQMVESFASAASI
jgi:hypothetical protein